MIQYMKVLTKLINYSLTIFFIAAAIGLAYVAIPAFGNKALIVRSGSMQPSIKVGDLIVVNARTALFTPQSVKIAKYKKGEIVAFSSEKNLSAGRQGAKVLTTHRIVAAELKDNKIYYKTKGDANSSPDQNLVAEEKILGKSTFVLPSVGKLFAFAKNKNGFILMVVLPALLVIVHELVNIVREIKKLKIGSRIESSPLRSNYNLPVFRVLFPLVLGIMFFHNSFAFFSDTATSSDNVFSAADIFPGALGSVVINEIMWMGSQGNASDEWIELRNMTGSTIDLSNWTVFNLGTGTGGTITIPSGKSVGPNSFFVIANDDNDPQSTTIMSLNPDHFDSDVSLQNNGEQLILKNSIGTTIDTANIDDDWFEGNDNPEKSMERNDVPGDGTVASNWHTATTATNLDLGSDEVATPRAANSAP